MTWFGLLLLLHVLHFVSFLLDLLPLLGRWGWRGCFQSLILQGLAFGVIRERNSKCVYKSIVDWPQAHNDESCKGFLFMQTLNFVDYLAVQFSKANDYPTLIFKRLVLQFYVRFKHIFEPLKRRSLSYLTRLNNRQINVIGFRRFVKGQHFFDNGSFLLLEG